MAERGSQSTACHERWFRSMWRHEQLSVRVEVATATHRSWKSHAVVGAQTDSELWHVSPTHLPLLPNMHKHLTSFFSWNDLCRTSSTLTRLCQLSKFPMIEVADQRQIRISKIWELLLFALWNLWKLWSDGVRATPPCQICSPGTLG